MTSKKVALAAFCSLAAVVGAASLAWACTVNATMALSSQTGPAGAETVVTAEGLAPGPATIRWNSLSAATLAETTADAQGRFSTPVRVPAASAGIYAVVVTDAKGDVIRSAFEVTGADTPAAVTARSTGDRGVPALALGVGVLAAGLVALAVGFGVASTVRRRVPVGVEVR